MPLTVLLLTVHLKGGEVLDDVPVGESPEKGRLGGEVFSSEAVRALIEIVWDGRRKLSLKPETETKLAHSKRRSSAVQLLPKRNALQA